MDITIVGGGLAGLTAAVAGAERGANVTLYESHGTLGGRARSSGPPYVANGGPHVLYGGQPMRWLDERGLLPPVRRIPASALTAARLRYRGRLATPPAGLLWAAARRGLRAPADEDFGSWATRRFGATAARAVGRAGGVVLMDHDPERLSAAFVWDRFQRATAPGHTFLVDLGLRRNGRDPFLVLDLDEGGFAERYTRVDPSLAPPGEELVQAQMPVRPGERRADVVERLERFLDTALPDWGERVTWRRDQEARGRSGALDLPGSTWRDRPAVDRGGGVYLAGDTVAAPGLLGEVSITSAVAAANAATSRSRVYSG